jgi:CheY-like chemotaxis protein
MCARILLVDDSRTMRQVLRTHLMGLGHEFVEADSGRAALEVLASSSVDLVICDVKMADIDGIEFLRTVRHGEELGSRLPIVLMSSDRSSSLRARCFIGGADEFLPKPINPADLERIVKHLLR